MMFVAVSLFSTMLTICGYQTRIGIITFLSPHPVINSSNLYKLVLARERNEKV